MGRGSSKAGNGGDSRKATKAWNTLDMNEAQIEKLINKYSSMVATSQRELDRIENSAAIQDLRRIGDVGNAGKSDPRYKTMLKRHDNAMKKLIETDETLKARRERLNELKDVKKQIKGTGKTLRQVQKEKQEKISMQQAAKGKLGTKWESSWSIAEQSNIFGNDQKRTYTSGTFKIMKMYDNGFYLYNNGKEIGRFKTLKDAKKRASGK